MSLQRLPNILIACVLALSLFVSGCSTTMTSAPPAADQSNSNGQMVASEPVSGGEFNKFFPKSQGDYKVNFRQEKSGFAQAKVSQGGEEVALLSINDTANNPTAASKFQNSNKSIAGYPAVTQGSNTTALLVANRYQVKVTSKTLSESEREQWLTQFNLTGLARVK